MFKEIISEVARLEQERALATSSLLQDVYSGQLSGLRMAMTILEGLKVTEQKFLCWGSRILTIQSLKTSGKERAKYTLNKLIERNNAIVANKAAAITPYLKGHTVGLESVLMFL